ncbi:predicted protein [Plenodomus lingam JN3]|uniref:Predicted protein n=1 Tax=Leptosphaeria maculans (strain JN3 / isolate v23.1.3 / race Av1-4-5-6-7-8) TaxID=985895 RepID=E4ZJ46_LEPMJ|nr:predicted protein [Plenodomus lingam JN3]CBX91477.1 predicted protein [Plenodomus lingam JN3]
MMNLDTRSNFTCRYCSSPTCCTNTQHFGPKECASKSSNQVNFSDRMKFGQLPAASMEELFPSPRLCDSTAWRAPCQKASVATSISRKDDLIASACILGSSPSSLNQNHPPWATPRSFYGVFATSVMFTSHAFTEHGPPHRLNKTLSPGDFGGERRRHARAANDR